MNPRTLNRVAFFTLTLTVTALFAGVRHNLFTRYFSGERTLLLPGTAPAGRLLLPKSARVKDEAFLQRIEMQEIVDGAWEMEDAIDFHYNDAGEIVEWVFSGQLSNVMTISYEYLDDRHIRETASFDNEESSIIPGPGKEVSDYYFSDRMIFNSYYTIAYPPMMLHLDGKPVRSLDSVVNASYLWNDSASCWDTINSKRQIYSYGENSFSLLYVYTSYYPQSQIPQPQIDSTRQECRYTLDTEGKLDSLNILLEDGTSTENLKHHYQDGRLTLLTFEASGGGFESIRITHTPEGMIESYTFSSGDSQEMLEEEMRMMFSYSASPDPVREPLQPPRAAGRRPTVTGTHDRLMIAPPPGERIVEIRQFDLRGRLACSMEPRPVLPDASVAFPAKSTCGILQVRTDEGVYTEKLWGRGGRR